jgi:transcriptional antiterminator RfaH
MQWYAINTKPRQERISELNLKRLGIETFSPELRQIKLIRRKRRAVISPLFPGYLFARFVPDLHFRAVNFACGVQRVVTFGKIPAAVDEEMIDSIKSRFQEGYVILPRTSFTPGQSVQIRGGPLQGLEAIFEREMPDQQRVVLLLQTLSYRARVVMDLEQVAGL